MQNIYRELKPGMRFKCVEKLFDSDILGDVITLTEVPCRRWDCWDGLDFKFITEKGEQRWFCTINFNDFFCPI